MFMQEIDNYNNLFHLISNLLCFRQIGANKDSFKVFKADKAVFFVHLKIIS